MSLCFLLIFFGVAHSFALFSKNLQSFVNNKLMPRDLVKMKAADPNWKGKEIFERITKVAGLFVHKNTNEIILETKEKMWTESEIIQEFRYKTGEFKNLIQRRDWNELFIRHQHINPFETYWRELLAEIVDLKRKNSDERTLLMIAVNDFGCNVVKLLLERGADVTEKTRYNIVWMHGKDSTGWTALHYAAAINGFCNIGEGTANSNNIEAIKLLLEYEANIDATDDSEETPLMWAVKASSACALKFLLTRGARLDLKNNDGHTALDIAKLYRHQAYSKLFRNEYKKIIEFLETQQK